MANKTKGVSCTTRNCVEYWYARINGKKEYCGKGEKGREDAEEARHKREFEVRQAGSPRQGIGLETRTTEFNCLIDMMNWYMTLPSTQKEPRSFTRWTRCSKHLAKHFGKRPIMQIEAIDLEQYRENRKAGGACHSTVDIEIGLMRMIYRKAKQNKRKLASYLDVEDIKSRKTPKDRKAIPISDELAEVLRRRMEGLKPTDRVFTDNGEPWNSHNGSMSNRSRKICKLAEVPYSIHKTYTDSQGREISGVDPHCYRVRRITKWAERFNDSLVRLASGHKNPQIFRERYCKLDAAAVMVLVEEPKRMKTGYTEQLKDAANA